MWAIQHVLWSLMTLSLSLAPSLSVSLSVHQVCKWRSTSQYQSWLQPSRSSVWLSFISRYCHRWQTDSTALLTGWNQSSSTSCYKILLSATMQFDGSRKILGSVNALEAIKTPWLWSLLIYSGSAGQEPKSVCVPVDRLEMLYRE